VVKGDAYGHGAGPVARALEAAGADGFCVATFDEAAALREEGIASPILVLFPIPPGLAAEARRLEIAVTVGDSTLLDALLASLHDAPASRPLGLHLEVETGLGRGGLRDEALAAAARRIEAHDDVRLEGMWTHFQAPEHVERTDGQVAELERLSALLEAGGLRVPPRHAAASGGLLQDGESIEAFDGVRPGLATYGIVPDELLDADGSPLGADARRLRPVLSLHARPVRVADLPAGWGISYGPTFRTARPSRIATLPIGYGDGWSRALSNRASALVRGQLVPLVGNVAMDAVMADVTDVAGPDVTVADEFTLIGSQGDATIAAVDVARARGTNSWEVVTGLSRRLPRVYHAASVPRETRTLVADEAGARRSRRP
jgi:alanine racemase